MQHASPSKFSDTSTKYTALHAGEPESFDESVRELNHQGSRKWNITKNAVFLCIAFFVGLLSAVVIQTVGSREDDIKFTSCGHHAYEARSNGCMYEPMQRSWIPPECYFSEPSEEYSDPFSDREWFLDASLTQAANYSILEGLRRGDNITAYTRYFHDEHCLYLWRKLGIAMELGLPYIDSRTGNLEHTAHCATYIARKLVEAESGNQTFPFKGFPDHSGSPLMFSTCVKLKKKR
jgi:hypothetical protein